MMLELLAMAKRTSNSCKEKETCNTLHYWCVHILNTQQCYSDYTVLVLWPLVGNTFLLSGGGFCD